MWRGFLILGFALCVGCGAPPAPQNSSPDAEKIDEMANNWKEVDQTDSFDALNPASSTNDGSRGANTFDPQDAFFGLPRGEGHVETANYCGSCHSLQLVMQQGKDEAGWSRTIDTMVARHGMAEPPPEDRALLVKYLSARFPDR